MSGALQRVGGLARQELGKVIVGQATMTDLLVLTIVCGGHALLEGVPGLAKTLTVRTLGRILRLRFQRVQCTPDLMPADIIGGDVFNMATSTFTEERQVTIGATGHRLSAAFTTFATQNPVEFEGTYPLPEAELDRFFVKIRLDYPDAAAKEEEAILERHHHGFDARNIETADLQPLDPADVAAARAEAASVTVEPGLFGYIAGLARRTRDWPSITLGASPRAAIHLMQLAKAMAAMDGRDYLIPDDVKRAALPVLRHRLVLTPEADLDGVTTDQVIGDVLAAVDVPK